MDQYIMYNCYTYVRMQQGSYVAANDEDVLYLVYMQKCEMELFYNENLQIYQFISQ